MGASLSGDEYYMLDYTVGLHCKVEVYFKDILWYTVTKNSVATPDESASGEVTFVFIADEGYKLSGCSVNGVPCDSTYTVLLSPTNRKYVIVASAVRQDSGDWTYGDSNDANDPPRIGENSPDGSWYVLIKQAEGTKLTVTRVYTEAGAYIGELVDGELFQDDYGTWYKYPAFNDDYFTIEAEALPGYNIDSHNVDGETFNFYASGIKYTSYYDLTGGWNFDPDDWGEVARIYTTATKIDDSGKDYGSGRGTLYFDATQYGAQYAVDFSYADNVFYVESVKVKYPEYSNGRWYFDLIVKINDVVISSGQKDIFINTTDWCDLDISGNTGITDEVKITLYGTASYPVYEYEFAVASPTVQTIIFLDFVFKDGVFIESESGFDGYTPYIYTEVISGYSNMISATCEIVGSKGCKGHVDSGFIYTDLSTSSYIAYSQEMWGTSGYVSYLYMLKFTTPHFESNNVSISINIMTGKKSSSTNKKASMNYAICTSDENFTRYATTVDVPDDEYMVYHGTFNEVVNGVSKIEIMNMQLYPNMEYYLFIWDTSTLGVPTYVEPAQNHNVTIQYPDESSAIYSYQYVPYDIYIDNGESWEKL